MSIALAVISVLAFHIIGYLPGSAAEWLAANLRNALLLNAVLALSIYSPYRFSTEGAF